MRKSAPLAPVKSVHDMSSDGGTEVVYETVVSANKQDSLAK